MTTVAAPHSPSIAEKESPAERYQRIRNFSETLCETLKPEDCCIQSMPDVSPTRWHLAHTTWFFETFLLRRFAGDPPEHDHYAYLFNSYYNAVGQQFPRAERGQLSRPTLREVFGYRRSVDGRVASLIDTADANEHRDELFAILELGLQHEQQHQELILTDIKHVFSRNPLHPIYRPGTMELLTANRAKWLSFEEGVYRIGHGGGGFAFDNESPPHRVFLEPFQLADRLVTCGEYLSFVADGGYRRPELWLAEGWQAAQAGGWTAPLYWDLVDGPQREFTLAGQLPINRHRPVCHISYYEADAFARWAGARLPTEFEWEVASQKAPVEGSFVGPLLRVGRAIHPGAAAPVESDGPHWFGDVWQWTASAYAPYPGYRPAAGALGEYNGKFMCNQYVLRGGSCATSHDHIRPTYRNFFPAAARWQFTGIRLAL